MSVGQLVPRLVAGALVVFAVALFALYR